MTGGLSKGSSVQIPDRYHEPRGHAPTHLPLLARYVSYRVFQKYYILGVVSTLELNVTAPAQMIRQHCVRCLYISNYGIESAAALPLASTLKSSCVAERMHTESFTAIEARLEGRLCSLSCEIYRSQMQQPVLTLCPPITAVACVTAFKWYHV